MILTKANQIKSNKPVKRKKKKKKVKTPRPTTEYKCAGCGNEHYLSIHHVYYGTGQRDLSSQYGCVEYTCWKCHQSSEGIHGSHSDCKLDFELKQRHQQILLDNGMSVREFISLFSKDYLSMTLDEFIGLKVGD